MQNQELLQSEYWASFQKEFYGKTFKIESRSFLANIVENRLPFVGKFFYVPRGPIYDPTNQGEASQGVNELIELAKKEKIGWIRFEPQKHDFLDFLKNNKINFTKALQDIQPREIFVLKITKPEEELLSQMKSKTRYNIRLAQKKGVEVRIVDKNNDKFEDYFNIFIELIHSTSSRKGIKPHSKDYYKKMVEIFPADNCKLYVAEFGGEVVAASLMVYFADTATYLHGGTSDKFRNVMAPFLLQWRAIVDSKENGFERYDFGGIDSSGKKESWQGITRFKQGFNPQEKSIDFPGTYDIIISPLKYKMYKLIKQIKK